MWLPQGRGAPLPLLTFLNSRGISITAAALTLQPRLREAGLATGTAACHVDLLVLALDPDNNLLDIMSELCCVSQTYSPRCQLDCTDLY